MSTNDTTTEDEARALLARNVANLNEGIRLGEVLLRGMFARDREACEDGTMALLDFMRSLDEDAREQMTIAALTTLIQFRDALPMRGPKAKR